ncbi:MAG TPA: ribbon-helix-helix domain-containing protein [Vicinamibacteria bacterium]|nr:ribbon-helix-helix domain-containing protein [Vicinamibacteria bacterium]
MASTSVHLPDELVERLDKIARESGRSRNRVIVEACEAYLAEAREQWPEDFYSSDRLPPSDEKALRDSLAKWLESIQSSRRNRGVAPF